MKPLILGCLLLATPVWVQEGPLGGLMVETPSTIFSRKSNKFAWYVPVYTRLSTFLRAQEPIQEL